MDNPRVVLLVDDDEAVRRMLCLLLRRHGLAVREAPGGREAVDAYRAHRDSVAVILMDVLMPGLDGPQTLALLKALDPAVRCCFLTGGAGGYESDELLALGALHVFTKPVSDYAELARTLEGIIRG